MTTLAYEELAYPLLALLRAENGEATLDPGDLKYGAYLAGGQGCGKTSVLSRLVINSMRDGGAAPIILDPKPELAPLVLRLTPPGLGKRVWYLDLGHPAFGMNPLRLAGDRPLPVEAAQLAENIVAALLDINENQIFQSSRRYLYHAVIGAIAYAEKHGRRAKLEDLYNLLLPAKEDFRTTVAQACSDQPDLDQTAEFFANELPAELRLAGSATAQRLDAPRNKIAGLVQVPALRRFFNHPTDIPLGQIITARDALIVNANMGAIGPDNSKACMHFILRMLHSHMQRQVQWPDEQRPRVPLIIDEAHYVLGGENIVDQFATHRRAGLEPVCAVQYLAQIGSGSEHQDKILKGVLNLLQSRFMFRLGDPREAEEITRAAMSVYTTTIRDDPDSRARLRVAPDQALNFPNYFCLASFIAHGTRAASFTGQTYPIPEGFAEWAEHHLAQQAERVAPYPDQLPSTLEHRPQTRLVDAETESPPHLDHPDGNAHRPRVTIIDDADPHNATTSVPEDATTPSAPEASTTHIAAATPSHAGQRDNAAKSNYEAPPPAPKLDASPVRRIVGQPLPDKPGRRRDAQAPESLRELAFLDRINEIGPADQLAGASNLPRLYDEDYAILALLDRAGHATRALIGRAVLPGRGANTVSHRLVKLYRQGLIAQHTIGVREHARSDGKLPLLYSLTRRGLQVAQERTPRPAISPKREWRELEQHKAGRVAHDLHALSWGIELHRLVGDVATDHWRTPRYATGRYPVPQAGSGRERHPMTLNELPLPDGHAIIDVVLKKFSEVKPDLSLELRDPQSRLSFDLLVELDLTARASYNRDKFLAYDAFLCGWSLAHRRYQAQGTRPVVVFVSPTPRTTLALARAADEAMTGRIGVMGTGPEHWYHAGRDHTLFAVEADLHHRDLAALALPPQPPGLRERLTGQRDLDVTQVALLPDRLVHAD